MTAFASLATTGATLLAAFGTGLLVAGRPVANGSRGPGFAIPTLAGMCALAALLPNLFLLGLPRDVVLGVAWALALLGILLRGRTALRTLRVGDLAIAAALSALCAAGAWHTASAPPIHHDVMLMWWPKVLEAWHGLTPDLHALTDDHTNQSYPRGVPWLTVLGCPFTKPTPQALACQVMAFAWLTALAMVAFARSVGRPRAGVLAAGVLLLAPDVAHHACSGMLDSAIAGAALLAAIGLARRDDADGHRLALAAAVGAASMKEEGAVVLLAVGACFALDVLRVPGRRRRALLVGPAVAVLIPFVLLRAGVKQTRMDALPVLLHDPHMLVLRAIAVCREVVVGMFAPLAAGSVAMAGSLVCVSLLVALPRAWPRPLPILPAFALLPMAMLVYTTTSADVHWHVGTTIDRMLFEMLPTLWLAAVLRITDAAQPAN